MNYLEKALSSIKQASQIDGKKAFINGEQPTLDKWRIYWHSIDPENNPLDPVSQFVFSQIEWLNWQGEKVSQPREGERGKYDLISYIVAKRNKAQGRRIDIMSDEFAKMWQSEFENWLKFLREEMKKQQRKRKTK